MGVRTYPDVPRVYVDLDDTLFDYSGLAKQLGYEPKEMKVVPGIYSRLQPLFNAQVAVSLIKAARFDVFGLTKCPRENTTAASDKIRSINEHFGTSIGEQLIITPDKGCVGTERDVLIDDRLMWANAVNFPGYAIHFGQVQPEDPRVTDPWVCALGLLANVIRKRQTQMDMWHELNAWPIEDWLSRNSYRVKP